MKYLMSLLIFLVIQLVGISAAYAVDNHGREYEGLDKTTAMQAVLATLQEIGFIVENVDTMQWTVKSTRYVEEHRKQLEMDLSLEQTVSGVLVQAEVLVDNEPLPMYHIAYHNFFQGLGRIVERLRRSRN